MASKSLHVAFLTAEYVIPPDKLDGGLATYVRNAARGLVARGHNVSVFCLSDRAADWMDHGVHVYEILADPFRLQWGVRRLWGQVLETARTFENSSRLAKRLFDVHTQQPVDVIQAASYQAVGLTLCNNGIIPVITRISSSSPLYRRADGKNGSPLAVLTDWCEDYQVRRSDRSFAPSELMVGCFSGSRGTRPDLVRSPVGAYSEDLDDSFYDTHLKGMKYLLYFGTLNRMKGVEVLSRAIGPLVDEFPDLHVVFIGRTGSLRDKQYYAGKILSGNGRWSDHMHHFEALPKQLLYPAVRGAYGVVIPSLIDNYPNTCLEAMRFGRIVVGTRMSSIDEMIVDGETGILTESGNVESLRAGISRLLRLSPVEKRDMEQRVERAFAAIVAEDRIGQLIQFYRNTIDLFISGRHQRPGRSSHVRWLARSRRELWLDIIAEGLGNAIAAIDPTQIFRRGK